MFENIAVTEYSTSRYGKFGCGSVYFLISLCFYAKAPLVYVGIRTLQYWAQYEKCQHFNISSTFFCCILCKFLPSAPSLTLSDAFHIFFVLLHWWFSFSWNTNIVSCEMTVSHVCIAFLPSKFWTWWSTAIKVHTCVKDLSKFHEKRQLAMKEWTYHRRTWNVSFFRFKKTFWEFSLLDSREFIHCLPKNRRKWGFVADKYLYFFGGYLNVCRL